MVLRKRTICGALPRPWRRRVATSVLRGADTLPLRLSALRLPLFFGGERIVELWCAYELETPLRRESEVARAFRPRYRGGGCR
jgi:hypothetical protein